MYVGCPQTLSYHRSPLGNIFRRAQNRKGVFDVIIYNKEKYYLKLFVSLLWIVDVFASISVSCYCRYSMLFMENKSYYVRLLRYSNTEKPM